MGDSAFKKQGVGDEENSPASLAAEAAATGARQAVLEAVQKPQQEGMGGNQETDTEAGEEVLVAGVLPLSHAQAAAASGAKSALDDMVKDLQPANRLALNFKKLKDVAASGASWGVKAAGIMARQRVVDQEVVAAAAATGAWIMCSFSARTSITPGLDVSKYTTLLGHFLGGSLPASVATYHLVSGSTDVVQFLAFGGITLGVFVIASGLIAGHFGNTPKLVLYTKIATIVAFVILLTFLTVVLCTLLSTTLHRVLCGTVCGCFIFILVLMWICLIV